MSREQYAQLVDEARRVLTGAEFPRILTTSTNETE